MTVDWTLRSGDILQIIVYAVAAAGAVLLLRNQVALLTQRLGFLEKTVETQTAAQNQKIDAQSAEIGKLGELISLMGRYEERFILLRREIDDLKHLRGFVVEPPGNFPRAGA